MKSGRGAAEAGAAGGPTRHVPVLLDEVIRQLQPQARGLFLDGTFGAGGYARALLAAGARVFATDRDPEAIEAGRELERASEGRLTLARARFSEIERAAEAAGLAAGSFDGVVFDIGVSSMQLDEANRGFSFRRDGPLDMRMSREGRSAAQIVNEEEEETLADIFFHFGEERASRRIARAIARRRQTEPFLTTYDLATVIAGASPSRPSDVHPATRAFQALRIAVNEELSELISALAAAERLLKPGGRLAVVAFHSLEDRIVKVFLAERGGRGHTRSRLLPGEPALAEPTFVLEGRQPVTPGVDETTRNPRARSAKMRFGTRTGAAPRAIAPNLEHLAALPQSKVKRR